MAKKSTIAGEYIIEIADNGHVDVLRIVRNADYLIEHKEEADKVLQTPNAKKGK
ncbi:MAG: hypothetical protein HUK18_06460 [Bacteroidales bacterium]|nr:hypothetical protein [Bacteroidales bacterium]